MLSLNTILPLSRCMQIWGGVTGLADWNGGSHVKEGVRRVCCNYREDLGYGSWLKKCGSGMSCCPKWRNSSISWFTNEGREERETDRPSGAASAVMLMLYWSVVVKSELRVKAKLSIYGTSLPSPMVTSFG